MWVAILFFWAVLASTTAAGGDSVRHYPSMAYECADVKAPAPSILIICSDPELMRLADERLAALNEARGRIGEERWPELWENQKAWARSSATACGVPPDRSPPLPVPVPTKECFKRAAVARIAYLRAYGITAGRAATPPAAALPDQTRAYVPSEAVEFGDSNGAPPAGQGPEPATATTSRAPPPQATSAAAILRGPVTRVPNAATLVVADQRIRLSGVVDPGPLTVFSPFENWLRAQGALSCEPDAQTGRYRCFTSGGIDVAEAAILNGAGRVGDGATPGYREREAEARQGRRGLWQGP